MLLLAEMLLIMLVLTVFIGWHFSFFDDEKNDLRSNLLQPLLNFQREKTEEALRITQEQSRLIIETASDAFVGISSNGSITDWNRQAEKLFGWTKEKAIGQSFIELIVSPRYRDFYQEGIQCFIRTGESPMFKKRIEMTALRHGGEEFSVELTLWALPFGNDYRLNAFIHDISDRKHLEKLKDDFVSTVSHELRTPLSILKGSLGNLKDGVIGNFSEKQSKVIETANRNVERLSQLIDDLLDLSRLESGRAKIHRVRLNPVGLLQEVIHGFEIVAKEHQLSILNLLPEKLPDIYVDPDLFTQLLNNLLNNAIRFAKNEIQIAVSMKQPVSGEKKLNKASSNFPQYLCFTIDNDGPNIPKESIPKIFNKFEQLDRPIGGAGYKGTGLGLAICKTIIEQHHGKIGVENKRENGISFYFTLPQYHDEINVRMSLIEMIHEAEKNGSIFSILALSLVNEAVIQKQLGNESLKTLFDETEKRLRNHILRKQDGLFFSSPTEYIILLSGIASEETKSIQERVSKELEKLRCQKENLSIIPCFSIGAVTYPADGKDPEKLLAQAIEHSYENKIKKIRM